MDTENQRWVDELIIASARSMEKMVQAVIYLNSKNYCDKDEIADSLLESINEISAVLKNRY